jgi:thiamine-phosphate pyrophosphorylase
MVITISAHSLRALSRRHVDAIFLSPVFATESHPERAALTAVRASLMARKARVPVYALGGVNSQNARRLHGFAGIAAIGALIV